MMSGQACRMGGANKYYCAMKKKRANIEHRTPNIEHRMLEPLSVGLGLIWAVARSGFGGKFDGNK